jgi:Ca2+/H+ antiporter
VLATLLMLVAIVILLPTTFSPHANRGDLGERLSLSVSVVLLLLHVAPLIYVLVTHRSIFTSGVESGAAEWLSPWSVYGAAEASLQHLPC